MRSRLAGMLSLLALVFLGSQAPVAAQPLSPYAPSSMPEYTPRWAMPQQGMAMPAAFQEGSSGPGHMDGMMAVPADGGAGCGPGCAPGCTDGIGGFAGGGGGGGEDGMRRRRFFGGRQPQGNPGGLFGDAMGFRWLRFFLPDDDGGACAVRWFDIGADFVYFSRDMRTQDLVVAELGFNQGIPALSLGELKFNEAAGFRFFANIQVGSASSLEFAYLGPLSNKGEVAVADGQARLTSIMSDFANFPFAQGFAETDFGTFQSLSYSSELDSFELSFRNRWMAPECRYQGSWLAGVRFIKLDEDLLYQTITPRGRMELLTNTNNSLTGFQIGGDVWVTPLPGLRFGAEAKAGIYGNHMNASNTIATTAPAFFNENLKANDAAFVGELDVQMTYRLNYHWNIRAGYNFLFMEGLALAVDNFNPEPPNVFPGPPGAVRTPFIDTTGSALFHGLNVGFEYLW